MNAGEPDRKRGDIERFDINRFDPKDPDPWLALYLDQSLPMDEDAKRTFKEELGDIQYRSLLPGEQKPPVELNRAMMEKFRPLMAQHYLKETPVFR